MRHRLMFMAVLALLVLGAAAVLPGNIDREVSLSSVLEIWGDTLRDADQFGLRLTRVSEAEEMRVGEEISAIAGSWGKGEPEWESYVTAVGRSLLPHVRRKGIQYKFHVMEASQVNAFALPGGQIYVTTGMLRFLHSEAELAAVLGHEITHVDLRHCIERYQYELTLKKAGVGSVGRLAEIARRIVAMEYGKYQEAEADAQGYRMSIEAGYHPDVGVAVFERLKRHFGEQDAQRAKTPAGEAAHALGGAIVDYFRSHPPSAERSHRLARLASDNRARLKGRVFYTGTENYSKRIPRSQQEYAGEWRGV